jgi:alkylated DNA repair dioxygenase AlkB
MRHSHTDTANETLRTILNILIKTGWKDKERKWLAADEIARLSVALENNIRDHCTVLKSPPANFRFDYQNKRLSGSLSNRIKYINVDTGKKTYFDDITLPLSQDTTLPIGIGLFKPNTGTLMPEANSDIIRLFQNARNYSSMNSYTRKPDVIALFWQYEGQEKIRLAHILEKLDAYPNLKRILNDIYVNSLAEILEMHRDDILNASAEIIFYKQGADAGLEQHIDNITRTEIMGPICSIPFVKERFFDLFPCLTEGDDVFRVKTDPGDLLVMDYNARIKWSHSVPYNDTTGDRYSIIIRPLKFSSNVTVGIEDTLDVTLHKPAALLGGGVQDVVESITDDSEGWKESTRKKRPPKNKPSRHIESTFGVESINTDLIDFAMIQFWKEKSIFIDFMKPMAVYSSARDMPAALFRNEKWLNDFFSDSSQAVITEAYGHDGADTLSFLFSFIHNCTIHSMPAPKITRSFFLKENIDCFKKKYPGQPHPYIHKRLNDLLQTETSMLYIDPPWKPEGSHREYHNSVIITVIHKNILMHIPDTDQISHICFKVRYNWKEFQEIIQKNIQAFHHTQTITITSENGKTHYFHTVSRQHQALRNYNFP